MNDSQDPTTPEPVILTQEIDADLIHGVPLHLDRPATERAAARREYRQRLRTFEVTGLAAIILTAGAATAAVLLRVAWWAWTWSP